MTNPQLCKNLLALIRSLSDADLQLATLMLAHFGIVLVAFPLTNGPNVKQCLAMPLVRRRIGSPPAVLRPNGGGSPQPAGGQGLKQGAGTPLALLRRASGP
jgi:hypothetical protein